MGAALVSVTHRTYARPTASVVVRFPATRTSAVTVGTAYALVPMPGTARTTRTPICIASVATKATTIVDPTSDAVPTAPAGTAASTETVEPVGGGAESVSVSCAASCATAVTCGHVAVFTVTRARSLVSFAATTSPVADVENTARTVRSETASAFPASSPYTDSASNCTAISAAAPITAAYGPLGPCTRARTATGLNLIVSESSSVASNRTPPRATEEPSVYRSTTTRDPTTSNEPTAPYSVPVSCSTARTAVIPVGRDISSSSALVFVAPHTASAASALAPYDAPAHKTEIAASCALTLGPVNATRTATARAIGASASVTVPNNGASSHTTTSCAFPAATRAFRSAAPICSVCSARGTTPTTAVVGAA